MGNRDARITVTPAAGAYDLLLVPRSLVEETKAEITYSPAVLHYRNSDSLLVGHQVLYQ